jgi:predicted metal-dependent HD superfamily phosphohydrolase
MIALKEMSQLTTLYTQPHRKYHNINHINDCLAELEDFCHPEFTSTPRDVVETAIWYHDAVYNPYSKLNEYNSYKMFEDGCQHRLLHQMVRENTLVSTIIMLTSRHLETHGDLSLEAQVMLDIDLSGFGKDRMTFVQNGMNIRHEYYRTKLKDFLEGRMKFYEALIKRPTLYYTEYFYSKYHTISQDNIRWEMALISEALNTKCRYSYEDNLQIWSQGMEAALEGY